MQTSRNKENGTPRIAAAFTLIEILVAIGIMALLTTMLVVAVMPTLDNAKIVATKTVISQIDAQLQARYAAFNDLFEDNDSNFRFKAQVLAGGSSDARTIEKYLALVRKSEYLRAFPQRVEDLYGLALDRSTYVISPNASAYDRVILERSKLLGVLRKHFNITNPSDSGYDFLTGRSDPSKKSPVSNADLLYLTLTQGQTFGNENYTTEGISSKYIGDTNNNGLLEFLDGWGNPIQFYNAPTALFRPIEGAGAVHLDLGARVLYSSLPGDSGKDNVVNDFIPTAPNVRNPNELVKDPFDPRMLSMNNGGVSQLNLPSSVKPYTSQYFYQPGTFFAYLLISSGPDGELGLTPPNFGEDGAEDFDDSNAWWRLGRVLYDTEKGQFDLEPLYDNITNRQK